MLQEYFESSCTKYTIIFILLYVITYYLSTLFFVDEDFLISISQETGTESIEVGKSFANLYFTWAGSKSLIGLFIKTAFISFLLTAITGLATGKLMKISLLSSIVYIASNIANMIYNIFIPPRSIESLRSNLLSIYSLGFSKEESIFNQVIYYHSSIYELLYISMIVYGIMLLNQEKQRPIKTVTLVVLIVSVDIIYIVITALWKSL